MHQSLFLRAAGPHLLLLFPCLLLAVADLPPELAWLNGLAGLALLPAIAVSYLLSDYLVTHRTTGRTLIDWGFLPRAWHGPETPDGKQEDRTAIRWVLVCSPLAFLFLLCAGGSAVWSVSSHWAASLLYLMAADLGILGALMVVRRAGKTFEEVVWPKVREAHGGEVRAARARVREFYDAHADLLQKSIPPSLFTPTLSAQIPDSLAPAQAWAAAKALVEHLREAADQEDGRRKSEEKARQRREKDLRRTDQEILALRERIEKERRAAQLTGDDSNEDEIDRLEEQVREKEARKEELLSHNE